MARNSSTRTTTSITTSTARLGALTSHLQAALTSPIEARHRWTTVGSAPIESAPAAATAAAAEAKEFKVYISADIEGIGGVVNEEHLGPDGCEWSKAREWMTAETVAAATAALEAGATAVVISDSHGNGLNIMVDELPAKCTLVRSWPRELGMMCGLDSSFECAMLVGYHPGTQSFGGVRAHTFSSQSLTSIKM